MKTYHLNLKAFKLHPSAETLLGEFIEKTVPGSVFNREFCKVFHDRKINKIRMALIQTYAQALRDGNVGAP